MESRSKGLTSKTAKSKRPTLPKQPSPNVPHYQNSPVQTSHFTKTAQSKRPTLPKQPSPNVPLYQNIQVQTSHFTKTAKSKRPTLSKQPSPNVPLYQNSQVQTSHFTKTAHLMGIEKAHFRDKCILLFQSIFVSMLCKSFI